jgi:hypothetical protein
MNANSTHFLARDRAAELLGEAERERLVRQAREGRPPATRRSSPRWSLLSLRRSPVGCR